MASSERPGTVHWIDHVVVGTNDLNAWLKWSEEAIGGTVNRINGLTTQAQKSQQALAAFVDIGDGSCHYGAFLQSEVLPPVNGLDAEEQRCGFFVRPEDLNEHVRRFDEHGIVHSAPVRTSAEGDDGTAVYFVDPDGNQYELWAPDRMPAGAMAVSTHLGVGRISSVTLRSRDLQRTADFFDRYCDLEPLKSDEIPEDSLVLGLAGGGRIVYRLGDGVDERVAGHGAWFAMHAALTVREDQFFPNYLRMWEGIPEEDDLAAASEDDLPARTGLHGSANGRLWKERYKRGDEFYDWDGHAMHFIGGISAAADGSLATYVPKEQGEYLRELTEALAVGTLPS
jgi:catechol 2,3-dioxygenase-like lactoylglutathione lyase family enzyme